jgi:hypothetical protein
LNTADKPVLQAAARNELAQNRRLVEQQEADASLKAAQERDQYMGFKPLPPEITAKMINGASGEKLRKYFQLYGNAQLTARLRGIS